jgi:hypothetical protein
MKEIREIDLGKEEVTLALFEDYVLLHLKTLPKTLVSHKYVQQSNRAKSI